MQSNNLIKNSFQHIIKSPVFIGALLIFSVNVNLIANNKIYLFNSKQNLVFPNPIKKILFKHKNNKVAAALAFPFPFGCVGLHRVYLGTGAHVPIVYAATAGGVFGLIPLLDCIVLLTKPDLSPFENNHHVIMWINHSSNKNSNNLSEIQN